MYTQSLFVARSIARVEAASICVPALSTADVTMGPMQRRWGNLIRPRAGVVRLAAAARRPRGGAGGGEAARQRAAVRRAAAARRPRGGAGGGET